MYIYIGSGNIDGSLNTPKGELPLYGMIMITMTCYFTGRLRSSSMSFTLHTEPRESPPEFSLTCRSEGGPATTVSWQRNGHSVQEDSNHQTSKVIVDTSHNSVYDNKLRVRGREGGDYSCNVSNNIRDYHSQIAEKNAVTGTQLNIEGVFIYNNFIILDLRLIFTYCPVAMDPSSLTAVHQYSATHASIAVTWESPGSLATGYVIYYQPKGGAVSNFTVSRGNTESHLLDGLQRGVTYTISIVALSPHLPSVLVRPVTVPPSMLIPNYL